MGEDPAAVENVGGLGDENLRSLPLLSRAALAESIGFGLDRPYALVTYHPETAGGASPAAQFDALCAALERCGLTLPDECCATARYAFQDGYDAALRLLEQPGLTAIFAMSDVMAIGAMRALHDRGLRIPEDISVIGFDGLELGEFYTPKLTTIRQQASLLVDRGVALLLGTLERGAVARHETVPFTLAVRESTSHPPRKDGTNS